MDTKSDATRSDQMDYLSLPYARGEQPAAVRDATAKPTDEPQSVNEELTTVNSQLQDKIERLDAANSDLTNFLEATEIATLFLDSELRIKRFTPAATRVIKLIPSDVGRPLGDLSMNFTDYDLTADARMVARDASVIEREVSHADGASYLVRVIPYHTPKGQMEGVVVTLSDVPRLRRAEKQIRRFARVLKDSNDAVILFDQDGNIQAWNRGAQVMYGWCEAEALQMNMRQLTPPGRAPEFMELVRRLLTGDRVASHETQRRTKDGRILEIWLTAAVVVDESKLMEAFATTERDITERKKAEASKTAVEILDAMGEALLLLDMKGRIISINPALKNMTGLTSEELIDHDLRDLLPEFFSPEDQVIAKKGLDESMKGQIPTLPTITVLSRTGRCVPVIPSVTFVCDLSRQPTEIVVTLRDLSELHVLSKALVESERKYRELVENANSIIMRVTPDHTITFFNEYAQTFFGYSMDEVIGRNVLGTIAPEIDSEGRSLRDMLKEITDHPELCHNNENENVCKDGRRVWVHWANRGVHDKGGKLIGILCVGVDITKRKELEVECARYQRRLQELAERLATSEEEDRWRISRYIHDTIIQNLSLSNVKLGVLQESLTKAKMDDHVSKLVATRALIEKATAECRSVMSDLTPALLYDLGLIPALRDLSDKVHEQHNVRIQIDEGGEDIPMDSGLRGLLFQSTRELVTNALKHAEPSDIQISVERRDHQITVQVQDNGKGFDPANLNRRGDGHSGFGLFSVRERVEGLGGRLEIESAPGRGTTARIVMLIASQSS